MKKFFALAALLALATMPSVPQRAYACYSSNCATDDSTATQVPAATDQSGKAQTACNTPACARPDDTSEPAAAKGDRLDRGVQQACNTQGCARPDEDKNPAAVVCVTSGCATPEDAKAPAVACVNQNCATEETKTETACQNGNCATPEGEGEHARAAASLSPGGAALSKVVRAVKERIRQQRADCWTPAC